MTKPVTHTYHVVLVSSELQGNWQGAVWCGLALLFLDEAAYNAVTAANLIRPAAAFSFAMCKLLRLCAPKPSRNYQVTALGSLSFSGTLIDGRYAINCTRSIWHALTVAAPSSPLSMSFFSGTPVASFVAAFPTLGYQPLRPCHFRYVFALGQAGKNGSMRI